MSGALKLIVGSSAEQVECRDELITDILSRVSTRDLLKMCTVVKRWRTLIFYPGFAHTHHENCHRQSLFIFSEAKRVPRPITPWRIGKPYDTKYGSFQFRSHNPQGDNLSIVPLSLEGLDIDIDGRTSEDIASNGLLCFLTFIRGNLEFLFYNPVTKFVKKLTVSFDMHEGMDFPSFFGFCCTQNTKKLVMGGHCDENETYTLVFDSQSNSWYKGPPPFHYFTEDFDQLRDPLFFNGVIYFLFRTPTIYTQEGEEPRDIDAVFRDENDLFYMIMGYDVNQDQWCFSVFIPTSVGYPYCLIEWDGKLLVLASNSTHEDNLFVLAASSTHDPKQKIRYGLDEGDGHFVFWILDTKHKLWTRERELDLSHEFHSFWRVSASGGVVWLTSGYNCVIVYHMKNGHCSTHRLDALSRRKQKYISFDVGASTSTPRNVAHRQSFTHMLTSKTPPAVHASMERGVVAAVASSTALTKEGLVTPGHECAPVVDQHHDYLYAVELQKSLERRSSGHTRKTPASYTSPCPRQTKISRDLFPSPRGK